MKTGPSPSGKENTLSYCGKDLYDRVAGSSWNLWIRLLMSPPWVENPSRLPPHSRGNADFAQSTLGIGTFFRDGLCFQKNNFNLSKATPKRVFYFSCCLAKNLFQIESRRDGGGHSEGPCVTWCQEWKMVRKKPLNTKSLLGIICVMLQRAHLPVSLLWRWVSPLCLAIHMSRDHFRT